MNCPKCGVAAVNVSGNSDFVGAGIGWMAGTAVGYVGWLFALCTIPVAIVAVRANRAIRILRSKQEPLPHAGRVVGHPDTILQKRENRHSKPSSGYAATPSTIESAAAVGMIRLSSQPAAVNNSPNCFSVRSPPPGKISICRSRNLPGEKSLPD